MIACGLLGEKLGHSYSPAIHAMLGNYEYKLYERTPDQVEDFVRHGTLRGFNVTIPYKQQVFAYLDELDEAAQAIGAVNVVKVSRHDGKTHLKGYNTDHIGFADSIRPYLKPQHTHALILGTGGASKAVDYAFSEGNMLIAEAAVVGRELTCAVYYNGKEHVALPVIEIITENEFFDYEAKYKGQSREVCPAQIPDALRDEIQEVSKKIYSHHEQ